MLLYIDPGTGSMLFTVLLGLIGTLVYFLKTVYVKLKFYFTGGRGVTANNEKIPIVIFSDDKRYWSSFEEICEYFDEKNIYLEYWTSSEDDPGLKKDFKTVKCRYIGKSNKAYAKLNSMRAAICLATTPGLEVYQWKRSKYVDWYAHIYHGASQSMQYRMFGVDFYDALLLTGPLAEKYIRKIEELRGIPKKEIHICGCTSLDYLVKKRKNGNNIKGKETNNKKNVLLAPTWGKSGILSKYGDKLIGALLKTDYHIIIRPHPQSLTSELEMVESLKKMYPENERLEWNFDVDNFDVLNRTDILISDFSGILYDFAFVFDKPFIYADTSFDPAPYDIAWIDEPLWILTILDRLGKKLEEKDFDRIGEIMDSMADDENYARGREYVKDQVWTMRGQSAKNISEYLIQKYNELSA